ncbi:AI-2E family transporter [Patescibacteria group bacterium]
MPDAKKVQFTISFITIIKIIAVFLGILLLWFLRDVVAIVFVALLLAALIDPFADYFAKNNIPRGLAVIIVYIVLGAIITLTTVLFVPVLAEQFNQLMEVLVSWYERIAETLVKFQAISIEHGFDSEVKDSLKSFQQGISNAFGSVFSTLQSFVEWVAGMFLVLVLAFYMVVEEDKARKYFKNLAPAEYQPYIAQLIGKMQKKIGSWLRAQLILGLIVGLTVYIGLSIIGVKYALLLALIAALFEIIPYVGPVLSIIPAALIGFSQSLLIGLLVLALYFVVQQIENNVLVPKVMQKITGLNPIISIVALLIGIKLGGVLGAVLAIPVATMAAVVLEDLFNEFSINSR